ncbi:MAG: DUF1311 domain-containing protein [Sphingomonadaceae bacterium]|nr:MAG: DUF1311 domain-containing protein [Sphingomonadaceae bacterium]
MIIEAFLTLAFASQGVEPDCGGNMQEISACVAQAAVRSEDRMRSYYVKAVERSREPDFEGDTSGAVTEAHLSYSQLLFQQHRDAECLAVYSRFGNGSIRNAEAQACRLHLNNARTHDLWKRWLTFPDGTAPLLPEPQPITIE